MYTSKSGSRRTQICLMNTSRLEGEKVGMRHRWGLIMIEIVPGPHRCPGVGVGIGILPEGHVGLTSLLLSVSVFSAVLGRSPSTPCVFLWFLHS